MAVKKKTSIGDLAFKIEQLEKSQFIKLKNGEEREYHFSEIVEKTYYDVGSLRNDLSEIKSSTAILLDFNKVHRIFKKWRVYWLIGISILFYLGWDVKDFVIHLIK